MKENGGTGFLMLSNQTHSRVLKLTPSTIKYFEEIIRLLDCGVDGLTITNCLTDIVYIVSRFVTTDWV